MIYTRGMNGDEHSVVYFAETEIEGAGTPFGIKNIDRSHHVYVVGKTGMGKSTLLENLAAQDIVNHHGLAFFDPHGNIAEYLLDYIPEDRVDDVVYLALSNNDRPFGFNVLDGVPPAYRAFFVDSVVSAFRSAWPGAWSQTASVLMEFTLLALLEHPGTTLLGMHRMWTDGVFRKRVADSLRDTAVREFWEVGFDALCERDSDGFEKIREQVEGFVKNRSVRSTIACKQSSFDLVKIMNEQKMLIVNLSRGSVGEANASLLGRLMVIAVYLAAISRVQLPEFEQEDLPPFYCFIDEFHALAGESLAEFLPHAKESKIYFSLAHQYAGQLPADLRDAIFKNVGTTISFRTNPEDAAVLEELYTPTFLKDDITSLGFAQVILTLMIDGVVSPPFQAKTLGPIAPVEESLRTKVLDISRKRYGRSIEEVDGDIANWYDDGKIAKPPQPVEEEDEIEEVEVHEPIADIEEEVEEKEETSNQSSLRDAIAMAMGEKKEEDSLGKLGIDSGEVSAGELEEVIKED